LIEISFDKVTVIQPEITSFSWKWENCVLLPTDETYNDDVQIKEYI
jgi:hypothetical protein